MSAFFSLPDLWNVGKLGKQTEETRLSWLGAKLNLLYPLIHALRPSLPSSKGQVEVLFDGVKVLVRAVRRVRDRTDLLRVSSCIIRRHPLHELKQMLHMHAPPDQNLYQRVSMQLQNILIKLSICTRRVKGFQVIGDQCRLKTLEE